MSDSNLVRFTKEEDKKLSSFLPSFLVKKIEKEDANLKQSLFLEDENEEEALEIKLDPFMLKDQSQNQLPNKSVFGLPPLKKSHSTKHINKQDDFIDFANYNPSFQYNKKQQQMQYQQQPQMMNQNNPFQYQQQNMQNNMQNNNNNMNKQHMPYQQNYPNNYPNNNFGPNLNNVTNNMNNLNINYNNPPNQNQNTQYRNFSPNNNRNFSPNNSNHGNFQFFHPQQQQSIHPGYQSSEAFFSNELLNSSFDSLNNSPHNISIDGACPDFMSLRPTPKKTQSDKNLKTSVKVQNDNALKSLFKDKNDNSSEEICLSDFLANERFDWSGFIRNQKGSRIMQKELNKITPENLELLIWRLCPFMTEIMVDTYGNYFSQRLIQCCSPQQRLEILKSTVKDFVTIACHNSGTHSIQCLMEIINTKEEEEVIKGAIKNEILALSYDVNGTHVMQKIIAIVDEKDREYLNTVVLDNILKLVYDANGICVIKKLINGNKDPIIKQRILSIIQKNCLDIIQNAFGNYIIQHVLDEWGPVVCKDVIVMIHTNIISLSMQKFSSNVVERCMDIIDKETRSLWVKDLFNFLKISSLLKNKYGNFVLQKAIMIMTSTEKKEIKEYLVKKINLISNKEKARLKGLIDIID
jgi:hypothetical protein